MRLGTNEQVGFHWLMCDQSKYKTLITKNTLEFVLQNLFAIQINL